MKETKKSIFKRSVQRKNCERIQVKIDHFQRKESEFEEMDLVFC